MTMTISIDCDLTWTLDPVVWNRIYRLLVSSGHRVIMATGRHRHSDDMDRFDLPPDMLIVYCGSTPKRQACAALGIEVDVWIDDMPAMIDGAMIVGSDSEL
jgi:hypothetical protein